MRNFDDPFEDFFDEIQEKMGSIMSSIEGGGKIQNNSSPQTDIQEAEEDMIITVDLQGFDKRDISVKCNGFVILINAKNADLEIDEQIVLPRIGNAEMADAKYRNGILVIKCPKVRDGFDIMEIEIE